ncbi:MAG: hypothetical protein IT461_16140 [Planctomycetes bacterium]|nr:hypothetical protein [Planctomycetota bacterium]
MAEMLTRASVLRRLADSRSKGRLSASGTFSIAIPRYMKRVAARHGLNWASDLAPDVAQSFLIEPDGLAKAAVGFLAAFARDPQRNAVPGSWRRYLRTCTRHYFADAVRRIASVRRFELPLSDGSSFVDRTGDWQVLDTLCRTEPGDDEPDLEPPKLPSINVWTRTLRRAQDTQTHRRRRNGIMLRVYLERIKATPTVISAGVRGLEPAALEELCRSRLAKYGSSLAYLCERFGLEDRALRNALESAGDNIRGEIESRLEAQDVQQLILAMLQGLPQTQDLELSDETRTKLESNGISELFARIVPVKAILIRGLVARLAFV